MIFRPELVPRVLKGTKTQTRRPVKPGQAECRYVAGRDYAVQPGRGKPSAGRIYIVETRLERLADITTADAHAEGFASRSEFFAYWLRLHGSLADVQVWAITFILPHLRVIVRPDTVLSMRGPRDPGAWDGPVLVRKPAPEPEKVPHAVVEKLPATMEAQQRWVADQLEVQSDHERLSLTERIERAIQHARETGVDPAVYEQAILRRVRALENRTRKAA